MTAKKTSSTEKPESQDFTPGDVSSAIANVTKLAIETAKRLDQIEAQQSDPDSVEPGDFVDKTEEIALRIYSQMTIRNGGEKFAANKSFHRAKAFMKSVEAYRNGDLEIPEETPEARLLDDAHAPNLPLLHPHNLLSKGCDDELIAKGYGTAIQRLELLRSMSEHPEEHGIDAQDASLIRAIVEMADRRMGKRSA